jgi:hypothetical protein
MISLLLTLAPCFSSQYVLDTAQIIVELWHLGSILKSTLSNNIAIYGKAGRTDKEALQGAWHDAYPAET